MKLFFDCETTGKCDFRRPPDAPGQPRLVSCAAVLTDGAYNEEASFRLVVRPDGWTIPDEAAKIHGVTTEKAALVGIPALTVLSAFLHLARAADELVAFNLDFDARILSGEFSRAGKPDPFDGPQGFICEMRAMAEVCRIPKPPSGWNRDPTDLWKWPSLQEAHVKACGAEFDGAHDPMADVRATIRVHKWRVAMQAPKVEPSS